MKPVAFYAVFGVVPGYHHDNIVEVDKGNGVKNLLSIPRTPLQIVSDEWQKAMQEEFEVSEVLVSAVLHNSNTVYPINFGCPKGGELTVTVNGHINPKFIKDAGQSREMNHRLGIYDYKESVVRVCKAVKEALRQTTVSVVFYELDDFIYLSDKD